MLAAVTPEVGAVEVREIDVPQARGRALVRMETVGICGTDNKILSGGIPVDRPRIMGHEMVGVIEEAADGGSLRPGTRVVINPGIYCGVCELCRRDKPNICVRGGLMGRDIDGVFAELVPIDELFLHVVPATISPAACGLLQVLGTVVHAQRAVEVFPDQTAAVIGLGVSGLLQLQMLKARGIERVVGITRSQWKRDLAMELGATTTAAPDEVDAVVADFTAGRGFDLVVESVGKEETFAQAIELAGTGGEVLIFGTATGGNEGLPYYQLYLKELTLYNPRAAKPGDYDTGIQLTAEGRLHLEPLVTARFGLDEAPAAFEAFNSGDNLKVLMGAG